MNIQILKFRRRFYSDKELTDWRYTFYWGNISEHGGTFTSPSSVSSANYFVDTRFSGFVDENKKEIYEGDTVSIHRNPYHGVFVVKYGMYSEPKSTNNDLQKVHLGFYLWKESYTDSQKVYHPEICLSLAEMFTPKANDFESDKSIMVV